MIGEVANSYMHVIGCQEQRERNADLEWAAVSGEEGYVTTLITAAKETNIYAETFFNVVSYLWKNDGKRLNAWNDVMIVDWLLLMI